MAPLSRASGSGELEQALRAARFQEVCAAFDRAAPASAADWLLLGRARLGVGRVDEAVNAFHEGLKLAPGDPALGYYLGCGLARSARWHEAETALTGCLTDPAWRERAMGCRAQVRVRAGLWAEAAEDYLALQVAGRLMVGGRIGLAASLVSLGRWEEADRLLDEVIESGTSHELVWLLKGRSLEGLRRWADAADLYRRALEQHAESSALATRLLLTGRRPGVRRPDWVLHSLGGRQIVLAAWLRQQAAAPANLALAHRIALLAAFGAQRLKQVRPGRARDWWRLSLANWAVLATSAEWQDDFLGARSRVYGQPITDYDRQQFVALLAENVDRLVEKAQGDRPPVGEPTLREEFLRERQACRACREVLPGGGIPVPGEGVLACGPILAVQLGVTGELENCLPQSRRTAGPPKWLAWPDPEGWEDTASNLRILFSSLGFSQARMEENDARGAVESLRWAVCPRCAATVRAAGPAALRVCSDDCSEFAGRNPGFAALPQRGDVLKAAAEWLWLQAQVALVQQALRLAEVEVAGLVKHWTMALGLVENGPRRDALLSHLRQDVLARAQVLLDSNRASTAVQLLEAATGCHPEQGVFQPLLAVALTDWGIDLANNGDPESGVGHLRRALAANPHLARTRNNFICCLANAARAAARTGDFVKATDWLDEADELCRQDGSGVFNAELAALGDQALLARLAVLADQAAAEFNAGAYSEAAARCEEALRLANRDWHMPEEQVQAEHHSNSHRDYLVSICARVAKEVFDRGDAPAALGWLERAERFAPEDTFLQERLRTVRTKVGRG